MQSDGTILERAFELAKSGEYPSLAAIRAQLKKEHFALVHEHLEGSSIRKQLTRLIRAAER